jgi:hypothetical protein
MHRTDVYINIDIHTHVFHGFSWFFMVFQDISTHDRYVFQSTLWLFNIAMENGPFIDGSPIKNGDFYGYVK